MKKITSVMIVFLAILTACSTGMTTETDQASLSSEVPITETPGITPTAAEVEMLESISYAEESPFQKLDVYIPSTGDKPFPTILAIHGGGFISKSKSQYKLLAKHYAHQGYAFVPINYRLAPADSYPAQVEDAFCALAWLYANQDKYGFDTTRIIVTGGSAGGYLASMLGTVDDPSLYLENCTHAAPPAKAVQAAIIYYGLYDLTDMDEYPGGSAPLEPFLGAKHEDIPIEKLEEMSPIQHIDGSEPPFIILHGTADNLIPSLMSERFAESLEQAGVDVELVLVPDAGHGFEALALSDERLVYSLSAIEKFLDRVFLP
jgi:acetyl esterase/lipase